MIIFLHFPRDVVSSRRESPSAPLSKRRHCRVERFRCKLLDMLFFSPDCYYSRSSLPELRMPRTYVPKSKEELLAVRAEGRVLPPPPPPPAFSPHSCDTHAACACAICTAHAVHAAHAAHTVHTVHAAAYGCAAHLSACGPCVGPPPIACTEGTAPLCAHAPFYCAQHKLLPNWCQHCRLRFLFPEAPVPCPTPHRPACCASPSPVGAACAAAGPPAHTGCAAEHWPGA